MINSLRISSGNIDSVINFTGDLSEEDRFKLVKIITVEARILLRLKKEFPSLELLVSRSPIFIDKECKDYNPNEGDRDVT